jgi:hypothetical protein
MQVNLLKKHAVLLAGLFLLGLGACTEIPVSGFKPISPKLKMGGPLEGAVISWPQVESLNPTLAWQPFPGTHEVPAVALQMKDIPRTSKYIDVENGLIPFRRWQFIEADLTRVSDVRYDLRIWEVQGKRKGDLVYDRKRLETTSHRIAKRLKPDTKYLWTVRARFLLDGNPRVSEWSIMMHAAPPARRPPGYPEECWSYWGPGCTLRYMSRAGGTIFPRLLYRFKTP